MAKYVVLINWTDQGVHDVPETTRRAQQVEQMVEQMGGHIERLLWTLGRYDLVGVIEAPDEETIAAIGLRISMQGAVHTETLRGFDATEMDQILGKLG